jgi:hypothetical protein
LGVGFAASAAPTGRDRFRRSAGRREFGGDEAAGAHFAYAFVILYNAPALGGALHNAGKVPMVMGKVHSKDVRKLYTDPNRGVPFCNMRVLTFP